MQVGMSKKQMVALKMDFTHNLLCGEYRPHKTTTAINDIRTETSFSLVCFFQDLLMFKKRGTG